MSGLKYLQGYPEYLQAQALQMLQQGKLGAMLAEKYSGQHTIRTDKALYDYVLDLKNQAMRAAPRIHKVSFDNRLQVLHRALGLHRASSRVQGVRLRAHNEIRIAALFKDTPPEFLRMIVVHELAHLKEPLHDKAFYQLCLHMEPRYQQYEFDLRLYLTQRDFDQPGIDTSGIDQ
ncbi:MAG: M48 family metallopeptidase [Gallionella sp.]|jgi:predicted metal-dependent hydrolase|nr:M48 family metallopeptidase [Gallionella sp.]